MTRNWSLIGCLVLLILLQQFSCAWRSAFALVGKKSVVRMKAMDKTIRLKSFSSGENTQRKMDLAPQSFQNPLKAVQKLASIVLLSSMLLTQSPEMSSAVPSGSRSGGSSFRSSGSMRSSTRLNSMGGSFSLNPSYRSSTTIIPVPSAPFLSPFSFGYPGFGFGWGWGWGVSPFSLFNPSILLWGGLAYATYLLLSNRIGGSDFRISPEDVGSLGEGASVIRLQIALEEDWMQSGNVMETFSRLASEKGPLQGRAQIAELLSEASLALLRRQDSWIAAAIDGERFPQRKAVQAEPLFQKLAIEERAKFDKESNYAKRRMTDHSASNMIDVSGAKQPTKAVVSIVAAIRGQSRAADYKQFRSIREVASCLQALGSEALTDEGENILAVEVLWTPSDGGDVLTAKDLVVDYPELRSL